MLGGGYRIIEEGCPGRTTIFEDMNRPYKRGIDYITPCLQSHKPLDMVAVMLGTNDCKSAFGATGELIAFGLSEIIERIKLELPDTSTLILSPIHLGRAMGESGFDPEFNKASVAVSKELAFHFRLLAQKAGCGFLDASEAAKASSIDNEHLDESGHASLARAIAEFLNSYERIQLSC